MKVPFYGHLRQYLDMQDEIDTSIKAVLKSEQYILGSTLAQFENELASYAGLQYAIGVGNCTDALWLTFMALGLGAGDELITNANTFFATASAMWIAGCTSVLVDCDPHTRCIDPQAIRKAITKRTRAIVPVHMYGQCAPMDEIRKIADEYGLFVVEDNAQAVDARGDTFRIGEYSDAVCFSFIANKNLSTYGDGGAVCTNHAYLNDRIRKLRNHGSSQRNLHSFGFNSRLDDLHAGILSAKLKHIKSWSDRRIEIAGKYSEGLADLEFLQLPHVRPGYRHVFHLYVIETVDPAERDRLMDYLLACGVDAKSHYSVAIHQQDGFPWGKDARLSGPLVNVEKNASSCISLPLFPEIKEEEIQYTIQTVRDWRNVR